jgi:hypothetical protein
MKIRIKKSNKKTDTISLVGSLDLAELTSRLMQNCLAYHEAVTVNYRHLFIGEKVFKFGEKVAGYDIPVFNEREVRAAAGIVFFFAFIAFMNGFLTAAKKNPNAHAQRFCGAPTYSGV